MRVRRRKDASPEADSKARNDEFFKYEPRNRSIPPVLTTDAVKKGLMPPLGSSGLPKSLEAGVPPPLRYWKAETAERAREVRDELVERAVFDSNDVLVVDGEARRVIWKAFLAEEDDADEALAKRTDVALAGASRLAMTEEPITALAIGALIGDLVPYDAARIAGVIKAVGERVCIALNDTAEHRAALAGLASVFAIETRPGVIFGSPLPLDAAATHVIPVAPVEKAHAVRLVRKDDTEERFVFGVVLEPDVIDSQGDTYSAAEVRKAAHNFMELHGELGKQHDAIVTGKLVVLETYISPVEFAVGEEVIKAGTWLLAIRVKDDELWQSVKSGGFTGFSIGGTAIRTPEATTAP